MSRRPATPPPRSTYRHGDLRRALVEAGVQLARRSGPDAVALREVTRRAGVVPNAAYRHFASLSDLLHAVRAEALATVARAMEDELEAAGPPLPAGRTNRAQAAERARARLRAIGRGYLRCALEEPGLFRTAFRPAEQPPAESFDPAMGGRTGLNPFQLLSTALDDLVRTGVLPAVRRPQAEYVAWSAVHGLAMLVIDGPLHLAPPDAVEALVERVLDTVDRGL